MAVLVKNIVPASKGDPVSHIEWAVASCVALEMQRQGKVVECFVRFSGGKVTVNCHHADFIYVDSVAHECSILAEVIKVPWSTRVPHAREWDGKDAE